MRNGAETEAEETQSTTARLVGLVVCSRAYNGHGKAREERDVSCKRGCESGCECEVGHAACSNCVSVSVSVSMSVSVCGCEWACGSQMLSLEGGQIA